MLRIANPFHISSPPFSREQRYNSWPPNQAEHSGVLSIPCVEMAIHRDFFHTNEPPAWLYTHPTLLVPIILVEMLFPQDVVVEGMLAGVVVCPVVWYPEKSWTSTIFGRIVFAEISFRLFYIPNRQIHGFELTTDAVFGVGSFGLGSGAEGVSEAPNSKHYGSVDRNVVDLSGS